LKKLKIEVDKKLLLTYNQSEELDGGIEVLAFWDWFC